ncbi:hypothetical protein FSOLCH5_000192 [Fusarium solani]
MKMRTSLFCALQGLGVVAHESLAYFKADHSKGGHRYLDGCGKAGKGNWVPDPATFVFPQNDFKPSDHWGLCADGHDCAPHEATGKVYFDFQDDGLVFNFEGIDHYKYEDVSIYVERARPPHAHSTKYNKDSDHCKAKNNYKEVKCHIPYFSLTDGGSYDKMCPLKGEGGWRFYIKIKATIVHGDKRYELYNRESTNGEKYFALSYTCAKCKHHKHDPKIELINAASRRDEGSEHKHYEHKYHDGHHDGYADSTMATTTATITRSTMITRSTITTRSITTISTATITRSTMDISTIMRSTTITRSIMITSMVTAIITATSTRRSTMPSIIMSTTTSTIMIMATAILTATSTATVITTVIIMVMFTIIRSTTATTMVIITDIITDIITAITTATSMVIITRNITATITVTIMVITTVTSMVTITVIIMGITMAIITAISTVMSITTSIITATTMATSMDTTMVTSMDITTRLTTTATTTMEAFTSVMPAFLITMV